ncbi:MAG: ABC transporter permease, partial [Steroidobacteraceae bacterium]
MSDAAAARGGLWSEAQRRLRATRAVNIALAVLAFLTLAAIIAPALSPWRYDSLD